LLGYILQEPYCIFYSSQDDPIMKVRITDHISAADMRDFVRRSSFVFGLKTALWLLWILFSILWLCTENKWVVSGIISLGLAIVHGVELCHQTLHYSGFKSRFTNVVVGNILGAPMLVSFYDYRDKHLRHHRKLGTSDDSEFFDYGKGGLSAVRFVFNLFMLGHYKQFFMRSYSAIASPKTSNKAVEETANRFYIVMPMLMMLLVYLMFVFDHATLILYFASSVFLVAGPVHFLIEFPEHFGCDKTSISVFKNTRTIFTNRLLTWYVNGNNFHVEHHLIGCAPLQKLSILHESIKSQIIYREKGYLAFYWKLFAHVSSASKH
jgi:fatty acid desaturase